MKFGLDKLKAFGLTALTAGKKNAPTLMTAGSVILGWTAAYFFWKQGKKAEKKIEYEEERLNADLDSDTPLSELRHLPKKDKFIIYLQYCWMSLAMGIGSSALAIGANQLNLSRLAEMALLTQFMTNKDEDNKKLIEKLKKEVPKKKVREIELEQYHERMDEEEIAKKMREMMESGDNRTLFVDRMTKNVFAADILKVTSGLEQFNNHLLKRRSDAVDKELKKTWDQYKEGDENDPKSPYYVRGDDPYSDDEYCVNIDEIREAIENGVEVYSSADVSELLYMIGEIGRMESCRLGEMLEVRCYSNAEAPLQQNKILNYDDSFKKTYFKEGEQPPEVCIIDYCDDVYPTYELAERDLM